MKKILPLLIVIVTLIGCKKTPVPQGSIIEVLEDAGSHAVLLATGDVYIERYDILSKVKTSDIKQIANWYGELWMVKNSGELVVMHTFEDDAPYVYAGLSNVEKVVLGRGDEKYAILKDGSLFDLVAFAKMDVKNVADVVEFGTGGFIALTKKGELWAWGQNPVSYNILAQPGITEVEKPVKLPIKKVTKLYASNDVALALCKNGDLYAWGGNMALQWCADDIAGRINAPKKIYKKVADVHLQTVYNNHDFSYAAVLFKNGSIEMIDAYDQIPAGELSNISQIRGDSAAVYAVTEGGSLFIRGRSRVLDTTIMYNVTNVIPPINTRSSFYEGCVFVDTSDGWYAIDHAQLSLGPRQVLGLSEAPYISTDNTAWIADSEYIYRIDDAKITPLSPLQP